LLNKEENKKITKYSFKNNKEMELNIFENDGCSRFVRNILNDLSNVFSRFESAGDTLVTLKKYKSSWRRSVLFIEVY
jgi:2-phosphoglycerate kinase